ncbi:MAG: serine/threonine-protein kinase [Myxococcaceae bacterium]
MACPHTQSDHCPVCAVTMEASGPNDTLVRGEAPAPLAEALQPGDPIGRYAVLERLGQGGMGVVYTAHDPQLQRTVAIKVLRSTLSKGKGSTTGQARLLREAQAMAQVAHPNVVQVFDSGPFADGIFIAMELVRGATLEQWVKTKRPWREVLRMYVEAGRGLEAAHAKGLVHRDFKPANVLVGADERPRVTDFGLARASRTTSSVSNPALELEEPTASFSGSSGSGVTSLETPLTQAGALMGSPGYMAPEQYDGAATSEATDQFSFCVSLYEALYGKRPFQGKTLPDLAEATRRAPVPPAPKGSDVPPWLHRIVVKGLAKSPADRHASMSVLLAALSDDPGARRRARVLLGLGAVVVLALVGAGVWLRTHDQARCQGADELVRRVWNDDVKRRGEAAFLGTKLGYAKASWLLAREALDGWAREWAQARTEACLATRVRGEQTERQQVLRFECLDHRLTEFGTLAETLTEADAQLVASASTAASQLSPLATCANIKQLEDRRLPPPELRDEAATLADRISRARALISAGRFEGPRAELDAVSARAVELRLPALEAEAREALGELEHQVRHFTDAHQQYALAVRAAEVAGDDPTAARVLSRMVSLVGWRMQRPDEARTWAALAQGKLARIGGDALIEARIEEGLGDAEWQDGRRALSLDAYRRALTLYRKVEGDESLDVARVRAAAGWVLTEQGELEAARVEIEESRALREKLLGPGHPMLSDTWNDLTTLAAEQRDYAESLRCAKVAVELAGHLELRELAAEVTLVEAELKAGQPNVLEHLEALRARVDVDQTPASYVEYGRIRVQALARTGRFKEAWAEGKVTLAEQERKLGKLQPEVATMADALAEAALGLGLWKEAAELSERYLAMKATLGGADSPRTGETLLRSAQALLALGKATEAAPRAERALAAFEKGKLDRALRGEARRVASLALSASGAEPERAAQLLQEAREDAIASGDQALLKRLEH